MGKVERMEGREDKQAEVFIFKIQGGKLMKCVRRKLNRFGRRASGCW